MANEKRACPECGAQIEVGSCPYSRRQQEEEIYREHLKEYGLLIQANVEAARAKRRAEADARGPQAEGKPQPEPKRAYRTLRGRVSYGTRVVRRR